MTTILYCPKPLPEESFFGYFIRLAEQNGYESIWRLKELAGLRQSDFDSVGVADDKLATILLNKDAGFLKDISFKARPNLANHFVTVGSCDVNYKYLTVRYPKICLECLKSNGFAHAAWDFKQHTACSVHGLKLLSHCMICRNKLSLHRPGLLKCKCGIDLTLQTQEPASNEELAISSFIFQKVRKIGWPIDTGFPPELLTFSLNEFLILMDKLNTVCGSNKHPGYALLDWPNNFMAVMKEISPSTEKSASLRKKYSNVYSVLFKSKALKHRLTFMEKAFVQFGAIYAEGSTTVDARSLKKFEGTTCRYVGVYQAAKLLKIHQKTVKARAAAGLLDTKEAANGKILYKVPSAYLEAPSIDKSKIISERNAAKYCGITVSLLSFLRRNNFFETTVFTAHPKSYHQIDVVRFKQKLEDIVANATLRSSLKDGEVIMSDLLRSNKSLTLKNNKIQALLTKDGPKSVFNLRSLATLIV